MLLVSAWRGLIVSQSRLTPESEVQVPQRSRCDVGREGEEAARLAPAHTMPGGGNCSSVLCGLVPGLCYSATAVPTPAYRAHRRHLGQPGVPVCPPPATYPRGDRGSSDGWRSPSPSGLGPRTCPLTTRAPSGIDHLRSALRPGEHRWSEDRRNRARVAKARQAEEGLDRGQE